MEKLNQKIRPKMPTNLKFKLSLHQDIGCQIFLISSLRAHFFINSNICQKFCLFPLKRFGNFLCYATDQMYRHKYLLV